ncbi:hypothetical protein CBW58_03090 [Yersinia frederiksenii]|nr:hypothetical protein CBW58_03090 [Yersinia frederiksenii]
MRALAVASSIPARMPIGNALGAASCDCRSSPQAIGLPRYRFKSPVKRGQLDVEHVCQMHDLLCEVAYL